MDTENEQSSPIDLRKMIEELERKGQTIEKEGNDAIDEFSSIVEDENKRTQRVADKEKERIGQERRANGTIRNCPICLEEIPLIRKHEGNSGGNVIIMLCCGALHCYNCSQKSMEHMCRTSRSDLTDAKCFNCREPSRSAMYWAKMMKPNEQRHWLLGTMANHYMNGTYGLKKNTKKAIKLFQRAAELGDRDAQIRLTDCYYYGNLFPRCLQKARYYAEKAVDQGSSDAQYILAELIGKSGDSNCEEEVFRLNTLAAFQGSANGRIALGWYY